MILLTVLSFVIPPAIALLIYYIVKNKFQHLSFSLLLKAFLFGVISIVLVLTVQVIASSFGLDQLSNIRRVLFYALVIMAFFSELGKFFFLKVFIYPKKEFKTPIDGIIMAVMISMGFATMNNLIYFIDIPNLTVNTANAFSAGPANVIFGVLMGFFIGLGKLRKLRLIDSMTGLAAAVFFHALYDFCLLTKDYKLLWAFFIGSAVIIISLYIAAHRMHEDLLREEKR